MVGKVGFISMKKRSSEEIESILRDFSNGSSVSEICSKYALSEGLFYRIIRMSRGVTDVSYQKKRESKINKLEKKLNEREREIALLKAALKKS